MQVWTKRIYKYVDKFPNTFVIFNEETLANKCNFLFKKLLYVSLIDTDMDYFKINGKIHFKRKVFLFFVV